MSRLCENLRFILRRNLKMLHLFSLFQTSWGVNFKCMCLLDRDSCVCEAASIMLKQLLWIAAWESDLGG